MSEQNMRQNDDGTWSPAEPMPFVPGIDVEVYRRPRGYEWRAYAGAKLVRSGFARTRLGLRIRLALCRRRGWRVFA